MQVEHKTEKGTVLFVKVPDDAHSFDLSHRNNNNLFLEYYIKNLCHVIDIDGKEWQLIGLTSEITEEQAKQFFKPCYEGISFDLYYLIDSKTKVNHALMVFESIMIYKEIYEANPYGKRPEKDAYRGYYLRRLGEWQQAELKTGKWIVLFKSNEK